MIKEIRFFLPNGEELIYLEGVGECTVIGRSGEFPGAITVWFRNKEEKIFSGIPFIATQELR